MYTYITALNSIFINLSIIISALLLFYFFSLHSYVKRTEKNPLFLTKNSGVFTQIYLQLLTGVIFGLIGFLLSINKITLSNDLTIDMRYIVIYFAVYYGSSLIGSITTCTLIFVKSIHYIFFLDASLHFFANNILLSLLLLFISIYLKKRTRTIRQASIIFILLFVFVRFTTFYFLFIPRSPKNFYDSSIYCCIFSLTFLLMSYLISVSIKISQSLHDYQVSALYDHLTGVQSREFFGLFLTNQLIELKKDAKPFAIALLDLDNFKKINDTWGHPCGDEVLIYFTKILLTFEKKYALKIGRIGGDEFIVYINADDKTAISILEKIQEKFLHPAFSYNNQKIKIQFSIGMLLVSAEEAAGEQLDTLNLYHYADQILYQAKKKGKDNLVTKPLNSLDV